MAFFIQVLLFMAGVQKRHLHVCVSVRVCVCFCVFVEGVSDIIEAVTLTLLLSICWAVLSSLFREQSRDEKART